MHTIMVRSIPVHTICHHITCLDFKKAFDSTAHNKLLTILLSYGVHDNIMGWLANFLSVKKRRINIGGILSNIAPLSSGFPQGSMLGPTRFSLYINDLPNIFKNTGIIWKLFADDVKLYCFPSSSQTQLQSALDKVAYGSHICQLQLAPEKCQVFSIAGHRKKRYDPEYHEYIRPSSMWTGLEISGL